MNISNVLKYKQTFLEQISSQMNLFRSLTLKLFVIASGQQDANKNSPRLLLVVDRCLLNQLTCEAVQFTLSECASVFPFFCLYLGTVLFEIVLKAFSLTTAHFRVHRNRDLLMLQKQLFTIYPSRPPSLPIEHQNGSNIYLLRNMILYFILGGNPNFFIFKEIPFSLTLMSLSDQVLFSQA